MYRSESRCGSRRRRRSHTARSRRGASTARRRARASKSATGGASAHPSRPFEARAPLFLIFSDLFSVTFVFVFPASAAQGAWATERPAAKCFDRLFFLLALGRCEISYPPKWGIDRARACKRQPPSLSCFCSRRDPFGVQTHRCSGGSPFLPCGASPRSGWARDARCAASPFCNLSIFIG